MKATALKQLDTFAKADGDTQKSLLRTVKENVGVYKGGVDDFAKLSTCILEVRAMLNKVEGDLTVKSLIQNRGVRTRQIMDVVVATRVSDPLKRQIQTWLRGRRNADMATTLKQLLRWIADKVVHLHVAFDEFNKFNAIKQRAGESTREYWIRFTSTAKASTWTSVQGWYATPLFLVDRVRIVPVPKPSEDAFSPSGGFAHEG